MGFFEEFLITMVLSLLMGFVLRKAGLPGGMMLGGIIGAACLRVIFDVGSVPSWVRFVSQSIAGGCLGASLDRQKLKQLPRLALPLVIIFSGLILADILMGVLMVKVSPLDSVTALSSGIPGGINDVPLIASEMGADVGKVAVLQFVRLFTGIAGIPFLIRLFDKSSRKNGSQNKNSAAKKKTAISWKETLLAFAVSLIGGYLGKLVGIPGGTLLFSMLAVSVLYIGTGYGHFDSSLKQIAQWFSGAYIGCLLNKKDISELKYLILPAVILVFCFVLNAFVTSFILRKLTSMSFKSSMLCCSPSGAGEIALLSSDLNIDYEMTADIMLIHVFRVILAVTVTPQIILFLVRFF